jgi:hypothetical protein
MRAIEFIKESLNKFSAKKSDTMPTTFEYPDMISANPYDMYRFGLAMADHTSPPPEGALSNHGIVVAYTPEEEAVIKAAEKVTGHHGRLASNRGSREPKDTNVTSPVAKPKRNKYGI